MIDLRFYNLSMKPIFTIKMMIKLLNKIQLLLQRMIHKENLKLNLIKLKVMVPMDNNNRQLNYNYWKISLKKLSQDTLS